MDILEYVPIKDFNTPENVSARLLASVDEIEMVVVLVLTKDSVVKVDSNGLNVIETLGMLSAGMIHTGEISRGED